MYLYLQCFFYWQMPAFCHPASFNNISTDRPDILATQKLKLSLMSELECLVGLPKAASHVEQKEGPNRHCLQCVLRGEREREWRLFGTTTHARRPQKCNRESLQKGAMLPDEFNCLEWLPDMVWTVDQMIRFINKTRVLLDTLCCLFHRWWGPLRKGSPHQI